MCIRPPLFSVQGRIDAWRFLAYFMVYTILYAIALLLSAWILIPLFSTRPDLTITSLPLLVVLLLYVCSFLPQHIPARRRLYDLGKNGKWSLLLLLPIINIGFVVYLLFAKGEELENKFGKRPCPSPVSIKLFCILVPVLIIVIIKIAINMWKASI